MDGNGPTVPNVWICLEKIKRYVDGGYTNKEDVRACIATMEKMFGKEILEQMPEGRSCPNGWPEDGRRAPGGQ